MTTTLLEFENLRVQDTPMRQGRCSSCRSNIKSEKEEAPHAVLPDHVSSADEADDSTCAICLKRIPIAEIAQPIGCDHVYCTCCILHWANFKEKPGCPQCKKPFASLLTFRALDGSYHDSPGQEAVAMLKCTQWFKDYVQMKEQTAAAASRNDWRPEGAVIDESDYVDYARYYQEYDDDEEVEDYYFSSAAGRARVVIGNRRHGPNGYMSSGRMQARPAPPQASSSKKAGKSTAIKAAEGTPQKQIGAKPAAGGQARNPAKPSASSSSKKKKPSIRLDTDDDSDECGPSRRPQAMGRRARRNQKKAAADAELMA